MSSSPANSLQDPAADANGSVSGGAVFAARDNPRAFFVRDALPSTEGPMTSSLSPSHLTPRASQEDQATSNGEQVSTQPRGLPRPANGTAHGAGPSTARESPSEQVAGPSQLAVPPLWKLPALGTLHHLAAGRPSPSLHFHGPTAACCVRAARPELCMAVGGVCELCKATAHAPA